MGSEPKMNLPGVFLKQAFELYDRLGFKIDQHRLNRGYPGPLHFLFEAQSSSMDAQNHTQTNHGPDIVNLINSIVPYTSRMGDGRWKSVHTFSKELVSSLVSGGPSDKFYVIHGAAGTGKSVYLATLFEAIKHEMCNNHQLNPVQELGMYSLPLFHSNLKHISRYEQLDTRLVLEGIASDLFPTEDLWSPAQLLELIKPPNNNLGSSKGIILIDSLDEYITNTAKSTSLTYAEIRKSLVETHEKFVEAGFIPVWSCRTREYHLLEMVEEKYWNVKASTPPALDTNEMAKYCFCEDEETGILGEIRQHSESGKSEHATTSKLLHWILKSASVNPLFFYFGTFTKNKEEAKLLTHSLIRRMEKAFNDVDQSMVLDRHSVMELQNQFVLSDFVVQTLLDHIYSNYTSAKYKIKETFSKVVDSLQRWVNGRGATGEQNLEHLTAIFQDLGIDGLEIEEDVNFRLMRYYGLIAKTDSNKWIWRHRSFPEYLCVSDTSGLTIQTKRISKIRKNWEDQHFNRSVWRWRTWSDDWEASRSIIFDRTGAYATSLNSTMFSKVPEYLDLFSDTDDNIDTERLEGEFGFSRTQLNIIQRGVRENKAIVLKGWPGTGKTYTGTHMLLGRLVNAYLQSGRAEYDPELASKGLIITLNPDLSKYLKEELDQYKNGPWSELANGRISWPSLKDSVEVLSMEEIISKLDQFDSTNHKNETLQLKDLRDIQLGHWQTFVSRCKKREDWFYDEAYDWKKASREYQESFMDEMGDFHDSYSDIDQLFPNQRRASEQWFDYVKSAIFKPEPKSIPLQTACIKLVHRFIQAFDYHGSTEVLPDTRLNDADERSTEELLDSLRTNPLVMDFSNALIDEVQDLPVEACLLISLLVHRGAGNQRSRVMLAGDEYQVLNQSNFEWSQFGQLYERKIYELKRRYQREKISANSYLYLTTSLNVNENPFTENFRNTPDIVTTWKMAGSWSPRALKIEPLEGIDEATCIRKQDEEVKNSVTLISYPANERRPYPALVRDIDAIIKKHSGVAFISMAPPVDNLLKNQEIEHYTPFTIKGLERNNAVVIGSLLFGKNRNFTEDDVKDERMKLIVGLSRAKNSMILVLPSHNIRTDHTVVVNTVDQTQHSLEQLLEPLPGLHHSHIYHHEAKNSAEVQDIIERIVGGNEEGRAIQAIDEYLVAQAYGSEQLRSIDKRVREICKEDIRRKNEVSYFWQMLQRMDFSSSELPVFLDSFILTNDTLKTLRDKDIPFDGTTLSKTLQIYQRDWLKGDEEPFYKIIIRHQLFERFNQAIKELSDLIPPRSEQNDSYDMTFSRIRSRIIDEMNHLLSDMQFSKYHWHENGGLVKDSWRVALLHYLVNDYVDIEKSARDQMEHPSENRLVHAASLLSRIGRVSTEDYLKFRGFMPESVPVLKDAIGVILRLIPDDDTSIGYFLKGFPVTEYGRILGIDALVRLIQYIMDENHQNRKKEFKKQLSRLFVVFCSAGCQNELASAMGKKSALTRKEFVEVYAELDARDQNHVSAKNLTFEYAQHILSRRFFESGSNSDLENYREKLSDLFVHSLSSSSLMEAKLYIDDHYIMPSDTMKSSRVSSSTKSLFGVVCDFVTNVLDSLSEPSKSKNFNQNGTIQHELSQIISILLKYNADDYLRDHHQSTLLSNKLVPDKHFIELVSRMVKYKLVDLDELIAKLIEETWTNLERDERIGHKNVLISWASLRYVIDAFNHHPLDQLIHQMQEISAHYPFLALDEEHKKQIVAVDDSGRFKIPIMNTFQNESRRLAREMKKKRPKFMYFDRSPYAQYRESKFTHLGSPVYLKASKEFWCRVSWDEYTQIASTHERTALGGIPVHIHKDSLSELPILLSTIRQKAKDRLLNAKTRVGVRTIVNLVRKIRPYNNSIPFDPLMNGDLASAKISVAYSDMLREIDTIVSDKIRLGQSKDGKIRETQELQQQELREKLVKDEEKTVLVQELWVQAVKRILQHSFNLKIDDNPKNGTIFIDVEENFDAINRLYRGE